MSASSAVNGDTAASHSPLRHASPEQAAATFEHLPPANGSFSHPSQLVGDDNMSERSVNMESQFLPQQAPFVPPMALHNRRERLLRIGSSSLIDRSSHVPVEQLNASTLLSNSAGDINFYGSTSSTIRPKHSISRRGTLSGISFKGSSSPPSPYRSSSRHSFFVLNSPIAYDAPLEQDKGDSEDENDGAAKANGIRVW